MSLLVWVGELVFLPVGMGLIGGVLVGLCTWFLTARRVDRNYQRFISQYLRAESVIHEHICLHVRKDKNWIWAMNCAAIVTIGIKEDFTLMNDEELEEARKLAGLI